MTAKKKEAAKKTPSAMTVLAKYFKLPNQSIADIAVEIRTLSVIERKALADEIAAL